MTLLDLKVVGKDDLLESDIYERTHVCDRCGTTYSFRFSCSYDLKTVKHMADIRHHGCIIKEDLCWGCRQIEEAKQQRDDQQGGLEQWA